MGYPDLIQMGLTGQKLSRNLKAYVPLNLEISGAKAELEAEIIYSIVPAQADRFDERGYAEHIELHSCYVIFGEQRVDITKLITEDIHEAIERDILGD
jgi:hypothetical protein